RADDRLEAGDHAGRRPPGNRRLLPAPLGSLRRHDGARGTGAPGVRFMSLVPGEDAAAVRAGIERVIASGWFVLGPEVEAFEAEFAAASGAAYAVAVGNGTDALALILRGLGIRAGDEVI